MNRRMKSLNENLTSPSSVSKPVTKPKRFRASKKLSLAKRAAKGSKAAGIIIEGRAGLLPGFKRFKRQSRIAEMNLKLDTQGKLIARSVFFLNAFFGHLSKWVKEESWVVREIHAKGCDLNNKLLVLPKCSCTPLQEKIWNGDADHFTSTQDVLGKFESMLTGKGVS